MKSLICQTFVVVTVTNTVHIFIESEKMYFFFPLVSCRVFEGNYGISGKGRSYRKETESIGSKPVKWSYAVVQWEDIDENLY